MKNKLQDVVVVVVVMMVVVEVVVAMTRMKPKMKTKPKISIYVVMLCGVILYRCRGNKMKQNFPV